VRQGFLDGCLNGVAAPLYLAHEHGALHRCDPEVRHALGFGVLGKLSLRFLFQEEGREFAPDDFEDET